MLALDNPDKEKRKAQRKKRLLIGRLNANERRRLRANDIPADKRRFVTLPMRRPSPWYDGLHRTRHGTGLGATAQVRAVRAAARPLAAVRAGRLCRRPEVRH